MRRLGQLALLGAALLGGQNAWGAISACTTTTPGTALTGYTGAGNGCASIDLSFENITITNASTTGNYVTPALGNTGFYSTGSAPVGNTIGPVNAFFAPITATDWVTASGNSTIAATFNYLATAHTGGSYGTGTYASPDPGYAWYFDTVTASIAGTVDVSASAGTQQAQALTTFCLGATATAGCAAENLGTIVATIAEGSITSLTCGTASTANYSCSAGTLTIASTVRFSQIAFSTVLSANHIAGGSNGTVGITNFGLSIGQLADVPEPGTYSLMGAGLLGLYALGRRKRQQERK